MTMKKTLSILALMLAVLCSRAQGLYAPLMPSSAIPTWESFISGTNNFLGTNGAGSGEVYIYGLGWQTYTNGIGPTNGFPTNYTGVVYLPGLTNLNLWQIGPGYTVVTNIIFTNSTVVCTVAGNVAMLATNLLPFGSGGGGGSGFPTNYDGPVFIGSANDKTNIYGGLLDVLGVEVQEGSGSVASGTLLGNHAEGYEGTASGNGAHAEGYISSASGQGAHAEGQSGFAIGSAAHSEGFASVASNGVSHAEGDHTATFAGNGAHAEGSYSVALGAASHAEGLHSVAGGSASYAGGSYAVATNNSFVWSDGSQGGTLEISPSPYSALFYSPCIYMAKVKISLGYSFLLTALTTMKLFSVIIWDIFNITLKFQIFWRLPEFFTIF